ncbi:Phosphoglycolate phosphatase, chromosomal [Defluviimonas aquaemixtae]|uniref:phosphoglycolate phosphatase n=1 Tax=Albidovulum aquaemixtae TaxID=1542388 RepID=A0A2R8BJY5_9RHOB|nr:HAD-IA family hydrolase [Defluviimonas aquaemixtae]SPH23695.1 Phosphoglycolate phosphatase, chromosomal [Defluviimonas aquaemixtae]
MRTVIFDLDGTLADTSADLIGAANECFRDLGAGDLLDPLADALTAFHGGRAMLRLGFSRLGTGSEAEVDAQYPRLLAAYEAGIDRQTRLYPGVVEAMEVLLAEGYATGICTNKPERLAELLLARLGVRGLFGAVIGADTLPVRKPDPAPYRLSVERSGGRTDRSMLVGDTETDRRTAAAAGVPVALVTFGPEGRGVSRLSPDALLDGFDALPTVAARFLPA